MMFKHLGRFGVLAVCLFAIVIVMGGCGTDNNGKGTDPIKPPPVDNNGKGTDPMMETPMVKLTGTYSLVESQEVRDGEVVKTVSGKLDLRPGSDGWLVTYELEDGGSFGVSGPTWTANATTLTLIDSDGDRSVENYTLEGKFLTLATFFEQGVRIEKWLKD